MSGSLAQRLFSEAHLLRAAWDGDFTFRLLCLTQNLSYKFLKELPVIYSSCPLQMLTVYVHIHTAPAPPQLHTHTHVLAYGELQKP